MLPLLKIVSDGKEYHNRELIELLAVQFNLTEDERKEMLASGTQPIFDNRVGWAKTYLKKAGLLDSPKRAIFVISDLGRKTLSEKPEAIDANYLKKFDSFLDFQNLSRVGNDNDSTINKSIEEITPEENLENSYQRLRISLAAELLNKVLELSPSFFERLVVELLVKMGYGGSIKDAGRAIGKSGDEGIDGTIYEDKLGLDIIYVQAKRWNLGNTVGRPEIQKFVGALAGQGAKKGVFITTSSFTREAKDYAPRNDTKIVLIDGEQLSQLMIDYNIGCSIHQNYEIKKLDLDYFDEE